MKIYWIKCSELMPLLSDYKNSRRYYIKSGNHNRIDTAYYYNGRWVENCDDLWAKSYEPTHWAEIEGQADET